MPKCKYCKKGNILVSGIHKRCKPYWNAEHIPKNQKKNIFEIIQTNTNIPTKTKEAK